MKFAVNQSMSRPLGFLAGIALALYAAGPAQSGSASSSISVTVQTGVSVGVATTTTTTTTNAATSTTSSIGGASVAGNAGFGIPVTPSSPTSNIGLDAGGAAGASNASAPASGTAAQSPAAAKAATAQAQANRPFSAPGASSGAFGASSAVAVAGAPNQTYTVTLPTAAVFAQGSNIVSVSNFQTNAGMTPALDKSGSDVFSLGASVSAAPGGGNAQAGGQGGGQGGGQAAAGGSALQLAFTQRSPFISVVISYN